MPKSDPFKNDLLRLVFKGTAIANIADNAASSPLTNLYVSLHTADPGVSGDQTVNECAYTGYARVAVARGAGWTDTGGSASPAADITFPTCTGGSETATHAAVGIASSGVGKVLYYGAISPSIPIVATTVPQLDATTAVLEG